MRMLTCCGSSCEGSSHLFKTCDGRFLYSQRANIGFCNEVCTRSLRSLSPSKLLTALREGAYIMPATVDATTAQGSVVQVHLGAMPVQRICWRLETTVNLAVYTFFSSPFTLLLLEDSNNHRQSTITTPKDAYRMVNTVLICEPLGVVH